MCVSLQLEKVYDPKNEEDDMMEMEEERLRMREHVMKNVSLSFSLSVFPSFFFFSPSFSSFSSLTWCLHCDRWTPTRTGWCR